MDVELTMKARCNTAGFNTVRFNTAQTMAMAMVSCKSENTMIIPSCEKIKRQCSDMIKVFLVTSLFCGGAAAHSRPDSQWRGWEQPASSTLQQLIDAIIQPVTASAFIEVQGEYRVINSNGLPDHNTGSFPNRHNPNRIQGKVKTYRVPVVAKPQAKTTPLGMSPFGVALNGIPFDPNAAEFWRKNPQAKPNRNWRYEALAGAINLGLDQSLAHVQRDGTYHYHGLPQALLEKISTKVNVPVLLGYAADGFPIYAPRSYRDSMDKTTPLVTLKGSYRIKSGQRPSGPKGNYNGDFVQDYEYQAGKSKLDQCNGLVGVTPEYPQGTYYYVITEDFPYIPRCFKGLPDKSFERKRQGQPPGRRGPKKGEHNRNRSA